MGHAQPCFSILGGQLPVTCELCNICTGTGEGTSFCNVARHSFTINLILAVFLHEVPIRTYVLSNVICASEGKRSIHIIKPTRHLQNVAIDHVDVGKSVKCVCNSTRLLVHDSLVGRYSPTAGKRKNTHKCYFACMHIIICT